MLRMALPNDTKFGKREDENQTTNIAFHFCIDWTVLKGAKND